MSDATRPPEPPDPNAGEWPASPLPESAAVESPDAALLTPETDPPSAGIVAAAPRAEAPLPDVDDTALLVPPDATAPAEAPPGPCPLSRLVTLLAVLVLLPGLVIMAWPDSTDTRLTTIADPERALARIVGRTMDLRESVIHAAGWQRWLSVALGLEDPEDVEQSIRWYEELAAHSADPRVDLHLAILEAEAGRLPTLRRRLAEWAQRAEPLPTFARVVGAAYVGPAAAMPAPTDDVLGDWLHDGWFRDRLLIALARHSGQSAVATRASARLISRGDRVMTRLEALGLVTLALGFVGLALGLVVMRRLSRDHQALEVGTAVIPPPWSGGRGAAVLLRGGAVSIGLLFVVMLSVAWLEARGTITATWVALLDLPTGLVIAAPTVLLARRHLFRPANLGLADGLGLRVARGSGHRIALVVPVVVGVVAAGDVALGFAAGAIGASGHWTEWWDSDLVFGGPLAAASSVGGAVIVAAVSEEILFRALLFATLRRRLGWLLAAVLSALAFAALHGYATHGFASVALSGLVWAWAYERTRSLWPAMIGHAFGNLSASMVLLAALR